MRLKPKPANNKSVEHINGLTRRRDDHLTRHCAVLRPDEDGSLQFRRVFRISLATIARLRTPRPDRLSVPQAPSSRRVSAS